ncbi:GntR family transcriptional regulator [Streptomyces sp. NBC_00286]
MARDLRDVASDGSALELPPDAALSENELAASLWVSRTPVRESVSGTLCVPEGFRLFGRGVAVCRHSGVRTSG